MTSSEKTTKKQFYKKRWFKVCGGACVIIILFFLLLPFGVKYYLSDWLVKNGADQATIGSFWYNPLTSRMTLEGLDARKDGKSLLSNSKIELEFGLLSLFKKDIRLQRAEYKDLSIDLEQYADGRWRFATYTASGQKSAKVEVSGEKTSSVWAFRAEEAVFSNCTVVLKMADFDLRLDIDDAEIHRFTTRDGQPAGTFSFKGKINQAPVELQLDTVQVMPELRLGGKIVVADFKLDDLGRMLQDVLNPFEGIAGLDGTLLFSMSDVKGMELDYDGTITLTSPSIGNSTFTTQAQDISWKGKVLYGGPSTGPMLVKTDGVLSAKGYGLQLPGPELSMKESAIELAGKTAVTIADGVAVENEGSLLVEGYEMEMASMAINEESLMWKGEIAYHSSYQGGGQFIDSKGKLELGKFFFEGKDESIPLATGGDNFFWRGKLSYGQQKADAPISLNLAGKLGGEQLQTTLVGPAMQFTQGKVELSTKSIVALAAQPDISGESEFVLEKFEIVDTNKNASILSLERFQVTDLKGQGGQKIDVGDVLAGKLLVFVPGEFPLSVYIPEIQLTGLHSEDLAVFKAEELRVKESLITAIANESELVRLDSLSVHGLTADSSASVEAGLVELTNLLFLPATKDPETKTVLSLQSVQFSDLNWSNANGLQGKALTFEDLVTRISRDKEGNLNITSRLAEMKKPADKSGTGDAPVETVETSSEKTPFTLGEIAVTGKSSVFFEDNTLAVPYKTHLAISQLQIKDLDSSQPDQKTTILFKGKLEKRASLDVTGHIQPFKETTDVKMKLKLNNYPLSSLSSYTVQSVGTGLASGQLKIKSKFELEAGELNMENTLTLKKLQTETISPELAAELDNELPISLDSALSILRDKKGNIELDIPLSGPVADLDVGISDILVTALSKAIVPAASGYLMYALGPYGALAYVGMKIGENMLEVRLPPVVFVQQEHTITEEHATYLERVATILKDKPDAELQLCPTVASWEFMAEKKVEATEGDTVGASEKEASKLMELGQQRAAAVKEHLISRYESDESRLLICDTLIDEKKNAVPAVLLHM